MVNPRDTLILIAGGSRKLHVRVILQCWLSQGKVGIGVGLSHMASVLILPKSTSYQRSLVCALRGVILVCR